MLENGWIKVHRSMLKWEWYDDVNTKVVFLHLLLTVSIEDTKWHGIEVKRGSRIISYDKLAKEVKLSLQQLRTALKHLEATGEITRHKHPNFTLISVNHFNEYQEATDNTTPSQQSSHTEATSSQQSSNNSIRKNKKEKEEKERKEVLLADKPQKNNRFVPPSVDEVRAYCRERGNRIDADYFVDYYTSCGWKQGRTAKPVKDWKAAVRIWERSAVNRQEQTTERSFDDGTDSRIYEGII